MKKRERTVLFTPGTPLLPSMGSGQVKEITHDRQAFGTGREMRTRAPASQAHECGTPENNRSQGDVRVAVYHVENGSDRFHLKPSRGMAEDGKGYGRNDTIEAQAERVHP